MSWHDFLLRPARVALWIIVLIAWIEIFRRTWHTLSSERAVDFAGTWPSVVAVVPARNEGSVIEESIGSLLRQDYPGPFSIMLVDDESEDDTSERALKVASASDRLDVLRAGARPPGWAGKLWAMSRGIAVAGYPEWLWLTDADIAHLPETLRALVSQAECDGLVLNSRMALLGTKTFAERAIVPAFVFFFRMLYPFGRVNDPTSRMAAAAGGCMLVRRVALERAGGVAAIGRSLIDDVALGKLMKAQGPIRLTLTRASISLRVYGWRELWDMIARSAFDQLNYSVLALVGSVTGLFAIFWIPLVLIAPFPLFVMTIAFGGAAYWQHLDFFRRSQWWLLALPFIALFFTAATVASAVQHWRGRGGMWKGRAQAKRAV